VIVARPGDLEALVVELLSMPLGSMIDTRAGAITRTHQLKFAITPNNKNAALLGTFFEQQKFDIEDIFLDTGDFEG